MTVTGSGDATRRPFRVGIGGPVGAGKSALVERLVRRLVLRGLAPAVVANDVSTTEDATMLRRALDGVLEPGRIVGVATGICPHAAVDEDPSANLRAVGALTKRYPGLDVIFIESGGDDLTLTFSPLLVDASIYVIDVAGGDRTPRKRAPGMIRADLLVINKADLAAHVGADLGLMERDIRACRSGPLLFTDCRHANGIHLVVDWLIEQLTGVGGTPVDAVPAFAVAVPA